MDRTKGGKQKLPHSHTYRMKGRYQTMTNYNFDAEMDLLAKKFSGFYDDEASRHISVDYRVTWFGIKLHACQKVFGVNDIPKIATEEHIEQMKQYMREEIATFPDPEEK